MLRKAAGSLAQQNRSTNMAAKATFTILAFNTSDGTVSRSGSINSREHGQAEVSAKYLDVHRAPLCSLVHEALLGGDQQTSGVQLQGPF
jgi:hypothetical protein